MINRYVAVAVIAILLLLFSLNLNADPTRPGGEGGDVSSQGGANIGLSGGGALRVSAIHGTVGHRYAVVSGQTVKEGDVLSDGYRVEKITADQVVLKDTETEHQADDQQADSEDSTIILRLVTQVKKVRHD